MEKKRIWFSDFWKGFDYYNNFILDALKGELELEVTHDCDYLFCSVFGDDYLNYDCIRIFRTGESITPDFNVYDYAIGFDWLEYGDRYFRYPSYAMKPQEIINKIEDKNISEQIINRNKFCNFVYSNAGANAYRKDLFEALSEYRKVDSGGKYLNNVGYRVENKYEFQKCYKFSIACENSEFYGYTTEKLIEAFAAKTIPIYWGNPAIGKEFNEDAFINCYLYNNMEDIVEKVREIDTHQNLYLEMLQQPVFKLNPKKIQKEFKKFLLMILEKPYDKAFRRNRSFYGEIYERQLMVAKRLKKIGGIFKLN